MTAKNPILFFLHGKTSLSKTSTIQLKYKAIQITKIKENI